MHHLGPRAAIAAMALLSFAVTAAPAQDVSKYPDWSGQWRRPDNVRPSWDPAKPPGLGQQAPLTSEYQAIFKEILADRAGGGLTGDPTGLCMPHGMPRMMIAIYPVEFIVTPNTTYYMTDYTTSRRIFTDGRDWPDELLRSFNGYSIGKWADEDGDGKYDVLEVETRGFKGPRTFEGSGMPLHRDEQTIIKERIFQDKADKNLLYDQVTVIDHALTRPWTVTRSYLREPGAVWDFVDCAENNPHVVIGRETYMLSAGGYLMPTKSGQSPPDLRYFRPAKK
jgi:hypothetical protein